MIKKGFILISIFLLVACSTPPRPTTPTPFPKVSGPYQKISINGDAPRNGIYDPTVEYKNDDEGWLAYSAIEGNAQPAGPYIHTRIAQSTDRGATWRFVKTVNTSYDDTIEIVNQGAQKGVWRYEVAALVYDPTDSGREWKLFFHRYFWTEKTDRLPAYGWIGYRTASDPAGTWSDEVALFGAGQFPPAPLKTQINLNNLHTDLKNAVAYSEPGVIAINSVIYLSLTSIAKDGHDRIFLLRSDDHAKTWSYVATLLSKKEAEAFGFRYFDGSSLAQEGAGFFLLASPMKEDPQHEGTMIFEFENIQRGMLKRDNGNLVVRKYILPDEKVATNRGAGQSDYDARNSAGGMIMPQFNSKSYPEVFGIYSTKVSLAK